MSNRLLSVLILVLLLAPPAHAACGNCGGSTGIGTGAVVVIPPSPISGGPVQGNLPIYTPLRPAYQGPSYALWDNIHGMNSEAWWAWWDVVMAFFF